MKQRILVLSSANMDFVMRTKTLPSAGQTLLGRDYTHIPGGKGANAALTLARLDTDCVFCASLGADEFGEQLAKVYRDAGIDTRFLKMRRDESTGLAAIVVEDNGNNRIITYPGANRLLTPQDAELAFTCYPDAALVQFEIPTETVIAASRFALAQKIPLVVDAGPSVENFPFEEMAPVEIFSPNETETEVYTGIAPNTVENCLKAAIRLSALVEAKYYVLKLGERGVFLYDGRYYQILPAHEVEAVDTTAAGDIFTAALTMDYMRTKNILHAVRFANVAGAISVMRPGASTSVPTMEEIAAFVRKFDVKL